MASEERLQARREAWRNLSAAEHYLRFLRDFIEIDDIGGAVYASWHFEEYVKAFRRNFEPVRAEFAGRPVRQMEPRQ